MNLLKISSEEALRFFVKKKGSRERTSYHKNLDNYFSGGAP
jgi:hypothetical protein